MWIYIPALDACKKNLPQNGSDGPRNEATCPMEGSVQGHTLPRSLSHIHPSPRGSLPCSPQKMQIPRLHAAVHEAEPGSLSVCPSVDEDCTAPGVHLAGLSVLDTEYMSHLLVTTPPPCGRYYSFRNIQHITYLRPLPS